MNLSRILYKILTSSDFTYNLYKRDEYKYHLDVFKKHKYKYLLSPNNYSYKDTMFYYHIDTSYRLHYSSRIADNISISYDLLVNNSLNELLEGNKDKYFVNFLKHYLLNIKEEVSKSSSDNKIRIISVIDSIFNHKSESFFDALQRILLINELLWQTGHRLNVLGRLDYILGDIYKNDKLTKEEAKNMLMEFLKMLHIHYHYKSNALEGDTGQVTIIGGLNEDGSYFYNELTLLFIDCIKDLQLPDPKILLRVSKKTPKFLLEEAAKCIATGCGSPLLSNDDVVIPSLCDLGYELKDACNYATSACWEPLCDGSSLEQNNIADLNFINVLNQTLTNNYSDFDSLYNSYKNNLKQYIANLVKMLNSFKFAYDPLFSTFMKDCKKKGLDISQGGARYNNFGILTSGLGNTIDALFNIKSLVYEDKKYTLDTLVKEAKSNFSNQDILDELKSNKKRYGTDDKDVIKITNDIISLCNEEFAKYKNQFGGIYRFGLSSPNYIASSKISKASLDGRKDYEPFIVHISSNALCSFTELVGFASKVKYGVRNSNGNVVDLLVSSQFIKNHFDKFVDYLAISIELGIFQMQFNVVDSATLVEAKKHPELYKNLIVRVWGFSAYFVELPVEYQDLLIKRAKQSETASW